MIYQNCVILILCLMVFVKSGILFNKNEEFNDTCVQGVDLCYLLNMSNNGDPAGDSFSYDMKLISTPSKENLDSLKDKLEEKIKEMEVGR